MFSISVSDIIIISEKITTTNDTSNNEFGIADMIFIFFLALSYTLTSLRNLYNKISSLFVILIFLIELKL